MSGTSTNDSLTGGCLCGAVRYEASGAPLNVRVCHCRLCQKATGQAFFARAMYPVERVSITGDTRRFASSEHVERLFCPVCGSGVFAQRASRRDLIAITLGSLDDPGALKLEVQIWTSSRIGWVEALGEVPGYPEWPEG